MQVTGLGWAGVLTEDFEAALQFFADVLGLSLAYRDQEKELAHFRFRSGQLLEIYGPSNRGRREKYRWFDGPALGFEVGDIQLARKEMIARGARFISELESWEDDMWSLFLGPEDRVFEIQNPTRRPASHFGSVIGICSARVFAQDFTDMVQYFAQVMDIQLARSKDGRDIANCRLPAGHSMQVYGPNAKPGDQVPAVMVGFEVEDMEKARRELEERGLEFNGPSELMEDGTTRSRFCAPDGLIYELVENLKVPF